MAQTFDNISFPGWEVVRKLGEGSFGGVYEIQRAVLNGQVKKHPEKADCSQWRDRASARKAQPPMIKI